MALFIHLFVNGENTPLEQEAAKLVGGDIGLLVSYQGTQNYNELAQRLGVSTPSVAFATNCPNGLYYFGKIIGTATFDQMQAALVARLQRPVDCGNVTNNVPLLGSGTDGGEIIESNSGLLPGMGFGLNLPKWAWWLVALASGYKSYSSKKDLGRYGFGALAVLAAKNAMREKKSPSIDGVFSEDEKFFFKDKVYPNENSRRLASLLDKLGLKYRKVSVIGSYAHIYPLKTSKDKIMHILSMTNWTVREAKKSFKGRTNDGTKVGNEYDVIYAKAKG